MATKFTIKGVRQYKEVLVFEKTTNLLHTNNPDYEIFEISHYPKDDEREVKTYFIENYSTQGFIFRRMINGNIIVELPYYSCEEDIRLFYAFLNVMTLVHRSVSIEDENGNDVDITEKAAMVAWEERRMNMRGLLKKQEKTVIVGINHDFHVSPKRYSMMSSKTDIVDEAFRDFIALQWDVTDANDVAEEKRHVSDDEEFSSVRVIDNTEKVFIGECRYVGMMKGNDCKMIEFDRFCELMRGQDGFRMMDTSQVCMDTIDAGVWYDMYHKAKGVNIYSFRKTFIMRWNTDISNYKLSEFEDLLFEQEIDGLYFDWSIWDYQKARIGDRFFMIRTGHGRHGIVMRGTISGIAYPDEDWSGKGRRVYYIRLDPSCLIHPEKAPVMLTNEELSKYLPNFNFESGHSGELVDDSTAQILEDIWQGYSYRVKEMVEKCENEGCYLMK